MIENDQWEPAMALASSSEAHPRWIASMCTASRVAAPRAESAPTMSAHRLRPRLIRGSGTRNERTVNTEVTCK